VFAATLPNGRIFKIDGNKATKFVDLEGADHVWALAFDAKQGALFAGTGPHGKVYRIDAAGKAQVYFESDDPHIVSLALAADGTLYAGSSGKALLYKITGPGRATVLYDFPGEDVKAIALGPSGTVFAISNEYADLPEIPKRGGAGQTPAGPVSAARPKPGKGTLTRFDAEGRPEKLLRRDDTHFVSLALGLDGRPYVGTGFEGRVYSVDDVHASTLVADTDERQVTVLLFAGQKRFIASSDPAVLHEVRGVGGPDAVWTSKVLDAGLRASFGRLTWRSQGALFGMGLARNSRSVATCDAAKLQGGSNENDGTRTVCRAADGRRRVLARPQRGNCAGAASTGSEGAAGAAGQHRGERSRSRRRYADGAESIGEPRRPYRHARRSEGDRRRRLALHRREEREGDHGRRCGHAARAGGERAGAEQGRRESERHRRREAGRQSARSRGALTYFGREA